MSKKDHVAGLAIQIPEKMIEDTIRMEIVKAVPNPEVWVEKIVQEALNDPKFENTISTMIRQECESIFQEWIKEHRAAIRESLMKALNRNKARRLRAIAEKLADGLTSVSVHSIQMKIEEG